MSNALRPGGYSDTEVPSYFLSGLVNGLMNGLTKVGSAIATGAGKLGSLASNIPVVGNTLQGGINSLGNGLGQVVSGNIFGSGGGLNSLYTGVDKLVGGILPGGQAFGAGYLGNLYGQADRALGGYLPNFGGVGVTPAQMNGSALAASQAMGTGGVPVAGVGNGAGGVATGKAPGFFAKGGTLDKLGTTANIVGTLGMLLGGGGGGGNGGAQAQYRQIVGGGRNAIRPGIQTGKTGSNVSTKVGGASSTGQGANQTGGLDQVQSGISESEAIRKKTKEIQDDFEKFIKEQGENYRYDAVSPMDQAREATPLTPDFSDSDLGSSFMLLR